MWKSFNELSKLQEKKKRRGNCIFTFLHLLLISIRKWYVFKHRYTFVSYDNKMARNSISYNTFREDYMSAVQSAWKCDQLSILLW